MTSTIRRAFSRASEVVQKVGDLRSVSLSQYSDLLESFSTAPPVTDAKAPSWMRVRFLGVSTLVLEDAHNRWMTDGFLSRPGPIHLKFGTLKVARRRVRASLEKANVHQLDAIFVAISHFDHALDSPYVAGLTGAKLYGSEDTQWIAQSADFDLEHYHVLTEKESVSIGQFLITPLVGLHSPGDLAPGCITGPLPAKPKAIDLKTGPCYSFHVRHPAGSLFIHPSANFVPNAPHRLPKPHHLSRHRCARETGRRFPRRLLARNSPSRRSVPSRSLPTGTTSPAPSTVLLEDSRRGSTTSTGPSDS